MCSCSDRCLCWPPPPHESSFSAGRAEALAPFSILGLGFGPLALAAPAGLLTFCPCASGLAVQAATLLTVVGLSGLGCVWEHLPTAAASKPSREHLIHFLLRLGLACFTGDRCCGHGGHVWPESGVQGRSGFALAALEVVSLAPAALEAELPGKL